MRCFRVGTVRVLLAAVLTLAMPAQWDAFCGGWQSPQQAMACCHGASHDRGSSAALSCCAAQEQTRHGQSAGVPMPAIHLVPAHVPVTVAATARFYDESPRRARPGDSRLLTSVFQI